MNKNDTKSTTLKLAIIISGRINIDKFQYDNFIKQYGKYNPDIFVSYSKGYSKGLVQKFQELYKPKKMIENDEKYNISIQKKRPETNIHNTICMFKNRLNALSLLKENNQKYDIIVSTRCDIILQEEFIQFENYIEKGIYIPSGNDHGGLNDQFAFGDQKSMNIYLNLFSEINDILNTGTIFHPETLLKYYLQTKEVDIHRINLEYYLKRYTLEPILGV